MSQFGFNPGFNMARLLQPASPFRPPQGQANPPPTPAVPPAPAGPPAGAGGQAPAGGGNFGQGHTPTFNFHFGGQSDILAQIARQGGGAGSSGDPPRQGIRPIGGGQMPLGGGFQAVHNGAVPGTPAVGNGGGSMASPQVGANGNGLVPTPQGMMTQAEAQRRGLVGPFSTQNLLGAFQQDVRGQQDAYGRQRERQQGAEQGFAGVLGQIPGAMDAGLRSTIDPLNRFASELEGQGRSQFDSLMGWSRQLGAVGAPDLSLVRRDLDSSNRAAGAAVQTAAQARAQYSDQSAQRASAIASSLQSQVRDSMTQLEGALRSGAMTPQQYEQQRLALQDQVRTQTNQTLAQYLDESERYRTSLTQQVGAAQQQQAGQLSQNAGIWANSQIAANQQQREGLRDAAQVASYAVQAQQRMMEAAAQIRQYVGSVVNASVINTANLMLQGWNTYSQMIDSHPEGYASITNGLLALAQVDAARNSPGQWSLGGGSPGGLSGGWSQGGGTQPNWGQNQNTPVQAPQQPAQPQQPQRDLVDPTRVQGNQGRRFA